MKIGFAGLSHLGLVSSIALASRGFEVIGYDSDAGLVSSLNGSKLPVHEPQLDELLSSCRSKISFHCELSALSQCDVIYIARDVPTDENNVSSVGVIELLYVDLLQVAKSGAAIVIHSQVPPGFCRRLASVHTRPAPIRLYYQVETLIFGRAVERALQPERYIVGCEKPDEPLPNEFEAVLKSAGCPILKMRFESAELAKIAINMFLVSSVSTTNTLAELCEEIGADWGEIAPSLRLDKRIGQHAYLAPGLGIAGGNLERDLITVSALADEYGTDKSVVQSWLKNSSRRKAWALRELSRSVLSKRKAPRVAVWGLAYKQDTHSIKNSPAVELIQALGEVEIQAHDPVIQSVPGLPASVRMAVSPAECCKDCDALVIMTAWEQFKRVPASEIAKNLRGKIVIDPLGVMKREEVVAAGMAYRTLGRSG